MRKLLAILGLSFSIFSHIALAQFTSVTATITDLDGQTWNNGKWTATLINPNPQVPPTVNGTPLTTAQMNLSGGLSTSGVLTSSMASNAVIVPAGTFWSFTICPNASVNCSVVPTSVSGTTQNLSTPLSAKISLIRFPASPVAFGYLDSEVAPIPNPGGFYYNVTMLVQRIWNGSSWVSGSVTTPFISSYSTIGTSGPASVISGNLNIPNYTSTGTLSGQTINYIPLATSPIASTISSHFFEAAGLSGVSNTFGATAAAPNCLAEGGSFNQFGCYSFRSHDDGTNAGRNINGFTLTGIAYGSAGYGGTEGRATGILMSGNHNAAVHAGIKQVFWESAALSGIGDSAGDYHDIYCTTGLAYASDEGCENYHRIGETPGNWNATITGGTNTQPTFTSSAGCSDFETQTCTPIAGGWMLDISATIISGKGTTAPTNGALGIPWLSSVTTDQTTIPASSAYGYKFGANLTSTAPWDAPISQTFTLQAGSGTFSVNDHACVISSGVDAGAGAGVGFTEQNIISAVSGTAGTQTITIPLAMPAKNVAIFKGDCMGLSFTADQSVPSNPVWYGIPAVSIDGIHLLYSYEHFSNNEAAVGFPAAGTTFANFDGGANSGFILYPTARILVVNSTRPGFFPFEASALAIKLSPNSSFTSGHVLLSPHYQAQGITGDFLSVFDDMAGTSSGHATAHMDRMVGPGINGNSSYINASSNENNLTFYQPFGGQLEEPFFIKQGGPWQSTIHGSYTPRYEMFGFDNHQTGQTSYNILNDPNWGQLSIDNTNTLNFSANFHAGGSISSNGIVSGTTGLKSGVGDGGGAFAGVEFPFRTETSTWLAQCSVYPFSTGNPTDLCVTSQGAARSSYAVTADRGFKSLYFNNVFLEGITHFSCINDISSTCYNGFTTPGSGVPGFEFQTNAQLMGGTFGNGGGVSIIANTPGDTATGGFINLWGSGRGDANKDGVSIGNSAGQGIEIDGTFTGHNPNFVGIFYPAGSIIPQPFSVNGTVYSTDGIITSLGTGTSPICPNGAGGKLTTVGCVAGGGTIGGSGTTGQYALFSGTTAVGNGHLDDGLTNVGAITSSEDFYAPTIHVTTGLQTGTGSIVTCNTSPAAGTVNIGISATGADCTALPINGTVQIVTQAIGDNSNKGATTAYVDSIAQASAQFSFAAATTTIAAGACSATYAITTIPGINNHSIVSNSLAGPTSDLVTAITDLVIVAGYDTTLNQVTYIACNRSAGTWTNPTTLFINIGRLH